MHKLLIDSLSCRLWAMGLLTHFVTPRQVLVLTGAGFEVRQGNELTPVDWSGPIPPGCTPLTCHGFRLDTHTGRIEPATDVAPR
jgi:hypothetical protein